MSTVSKLRRLIADQLKAELPRGAVIGREIIVLEQTSSTNDAVSRVASTDGLPSVPEGLVVFAEHQTAGRGQRGNRWESTAGKGLWFSILLRPEILLSNSGRLTIWAMEAISDVIRSEFGLEPAIKLPNDVQLDEHKLAGVLVEMRAQDKAPHLAVVGIGINVNQCRDDFPAELQDNPISLAMALGREVALQNFALALLRKLDLTYREKFSKQA
ncbi:MAG: biotin--[acetyl-CoA-carboxylase] ligase [Chthoniobacterales bacterium]|jgi:BirA family transcriptional regulator, biotin operon repressor / biotin---[acetyl-CoA-carboxylase] ligase